jgi:nitroreductase
MHVLEQQPSVIGVPEERRLQMDVFDAIRTILAVRRYKDQPVPETVIRRILEAGRLAASAGNAQPWHFIVVQDRSIMRQFGALVQTGPYVAQAALAIVVAIDRTPFAVSDASRAIQDMLLVAWGEGVGSNWVGFVGGLVAVGQLLGVPPERDVLALLPFGYPATPIGRGKKNRKSLPEVASRERYGQPFE